MSKNKSRQFLNLVSIPQLTEDQFKDCEFILSENDLLLVVKSMPNDKSPSKDGLTKEFYEVFWEDSVNHLFLITALKTFGFGEAFIS